MNEFVQEYCPDGKDYKNFGPGDVPVYGADGIMTYIAAKGESSTVTSG